MSSLSDSTLPLAVGPTALRLRALALWAVAAGLLAYAGLAPVEPVLRNLFLAAGGAIMLVLAAYAAMMWRMRGAAELAQEILAGFIEKDAAPSFVTDHDGRITARNSAASVRFSASGDGTLAATLRSVLASPSAVLYRLQCRARIDGNAREDVLTARGHVRLAVHRLRDGAFLWRFEDILERGPGGRGAVPLPMLTVGRTGAILFMNDAARRLVGNRALTLDRLFLGAAPVSGRIHTLTTADGPVEVLVREIAGPAARREMFLIPVDDMRGAGSSNDFDNLPVPMMRLSDAGEIREINRLAVKLVGADVRAGADLSDIMQGLGRPIIDWLRETVEGSAKQRSEFLRLARRDKEVFVQVTLTRVTEDGVGGLVAVLNDATELKTLEAQFVQSQKMQAIGQLAGGVAHDFNNLLTAISGHCDLLLLRHDQGDPDYGDLVQIHQNANRAAALVSQLLAFSRKQTLRPERLDLRDTLSDLTHLLNRLVGEKVTLTLSHDPVLKPVRADKRQLEQVLMNLVVNARDAMPQGGEIRIETEVVTLDAPLERDRAVVPPGDYVTVKVSDKGVGIAPDALQKVFEPFYTTKRTGEGTGLGLSTVYGIVKQTGGYIFVDSVVGEGSDFVLFFPADSLPEAKPEAEPAPEPAPAPRQGDGVVLLVEDEAPVRAFASRALRLRGYTVLEAESAEDALRTLEDSELSVDVFVTDVVMPGLDGPTWVRQAMRDRPDVRVVFVSGYAEGAFGEAELSLPNSVFLPKPFSLNQLTETVHRQMH